MSVSALFQSFKMRELALAGLLLVAGAWPDDGVRRGFAEFYAQTTDSLIFEDLELGRGGGMRIIAAPHHDKGLVSQDAVLQMRIKGVSRRAKLGINLRRDVYLPILIAFCSAMAVPLSVSGKAITALASTFVTLVLATLALVGLATWYLATQASAFGVYPPGGTMVKISEFLFRYVFTPPSHRFIVPLAVSLICFLLVRTWQQRGQAQRAGA